MIAEISRLNVVRLRLGLSWQGLSDRMKRAGCYVPFRTLHYLGTGQSHKPHATTLYRIRKFLDSPLARSRRRRKRTAATEAAPEVHP